jgi:hypothetical protein
MNNNVTCKNCKNNISNWFTRNFSASVWWKCGIEENYEPVSYNPVDGTSKGGYYNSCGLARGLSDRCGTEGKRWEPRHKRDLFVFLKRI